MTTETPSNVLDLDGRARSAASRRPSDHAAARRRSALEERVADAGEGSRSRRYRKKRDFTVTSEPSGADRSPPPTAVDDSSCSATGPAACTTTSGWRSTACSSAGRCRRDRRSTRREAAGGPRRGPPARVLRLRGRDPRRRVRRRRRHRVGLGHLGAGRGRRSASKPIEDGELHFDLHGEKLQRPVRARPSRRRRAGREQWLLLHKHDDAAVTGWDPEEHPRVGEVGPHQRRGQGRAGGDVVEHRDLGGADAPTSSPRSTRSGRAGKWELGEHTLQLTNLDKVLFPATKPHRAVTKRDLDPPLRHASRRRCSRTSPTGRSTCTASRTASTKAGFWHKAAPVARARLARRGGATTTPIPARPRSTSSSTRRRRSRGSPTTARSSCTRGRRRAEHAAPADLGADRHRPRRVDTSFDDVLRRSRGCTAPRSSTSALQAMPKVTGQRGIQIWVPVAERLHVRRDPGVGREALAHDRRQSVPELVSWEWEVAKRERQAAARLHAERDQQDARRAVQPAARARRARVGADHVGRARRPRSPARSLDHRHHR